MNKNEKILSNMLENYKHINEGLETEIYELEKELDDKDRYISDLKKKLSNVRPTEDCILTAHDTGTWWLLAVEDNECRVIAYLKWPASWKNIKSANELEEYGFEIV